MNEEERQMNKHPNYGYNMEMPNGKIILYGGKQHGKKKNN